MIDPRSASILHADLDAFYASVEQRDQPSLRGKPVIVGGGVVLAASYEARRRGVKTAMSGGEARRRCPEAIVVSPRMDAYSEASKRVFAVFEDTTPFVEGISIDEAFLDVGGLRRIAGEPIEIAERLRRRVRDDVGLPISVGIARTKFLAKVASGVAKPDGIRFVDPHGELEFLHPLPVRRLWGVGPVTEEKLHEVGITTVGQVARRTEADLVSIAGVAAGHKLHALAHNKDPRRVVTGRRRKSIGSQRAIGRGNWTPDDIDRTLVGIVDRVTRRMRRAGRAGRTVVIRLRFDDFARITRSRTLPELTDATAPVLAACRELVAGVADEIAERGVTLIGLSVGNLDDESLQLELPFGSHDRRALDVATDAIRERFGKDAIGRALLLGSRDDDRSVPMLPD
ncbi:MAG TPA: DNA polymerase IV [Acidimicrobiales bacterium]|nr:DNA polymerase IV [Acidimicrobiales bacterium]